MPGVLYKGNNYTFPVSTVVTASNVAKALGLDFSKQWLIEDLETGEIAESLKDGSNYILSCSSDFHNIAPIVTQTIQPMVFGSAGVLSVPPKTTWNKKVNANNSPIVPAKKKKEEKLLTIPWRIVSAGPTGFPDDGISGIGGTMLMAAPTSEKIFNEIQKKCEIPIPFRTFVHIRPQWVEISVDPKDNGDDAIWLEYFSGRYTRQLFITPNEGAILSRTDQQYSILLKDFENENEKLAEQKEALKKEVKELKKLKEMIKEALRCDICLEIKRAGFICCPRCKRFPACKECWSTIQKTAIEKAQNDFDIDRDAGLLTNREIQNGPVPKVNCPRCRFDMEKYDGSEEFGVVNTQLCDILTFFVEEEKEKEGDS